jgi:hypothetical protein
MIKACRESQRQDVTAFGLGLQDLFAGADTVEAIAASHNLANILLCHSPWAPKAKDGDSG